MSPWPEGASPDRPDTVSELWGEPTPLDRHVTVPAFPVEVFPPWLADQVTAVAEFTQTDPAMAGAVALGTLAACAGGRLEVEARPGWRVPTNLYLAVVAKPGERKSPVQMAMTAPLRAAEVELAEHARPMATEAETLRDIAQVAVEKAKNAAAKSTKEERDALAAEAIAAAKAAEAITIPTVPRLLCDDTTPERLAGLLEENQGRIALISDEGGIFDTIAGRYSRLPNLDVFLKAHDGSEMRVDRIGRGAQFVAKPALTVSLMVQDSVLRRVGANQDFRGRGLLARFFFILPRSKVGSRLVDPEPVPTPTSSHYADNMRKLVRTLAEWSDPAAISLTEDARKLLFEAMRAIEDRLGPGGVLDHIAEWATKLAGATVRVAGLLHLAHELENGWRLPIDGPTMADAIKLADVLAAHYRAATEAMGLDRTTEDAGYLLPIIRRIAQPAVAMTTTHVFTVRELFSAVTRSRFPKVRDMTAALDLLQDHDWIMRLPDPERDGPGRKPSPKYALNPAAKSAVSAE